MVVIILRTNKTEKFDFSTLRFLEYSFMSIILLYVLTERLF